MSSAFIRGEHSPSRRVIVQGFCRVPVADLLEPVKPGVREIAVRERLVAIAPACDVLSPDADLVDVTARLVELFDPTAKTRERALKIRDAAPVPLTDIAGEAAGR